MGYGALRHLSPDVIAETAGDHDTDVPVPAGLPNVLNLGCGRKHVADAVNLDLRPSTDPDVVHDLNRLPWPFPSGCFSRVLAYDVIEHLDDVVATMEEIHRVCRDGAVVQITVPHFSSANAFTDVTHRHFFGWFSLQYFTDNVDLSFYSDVRFRRRTADIVFSRSIVNKLIWRLARRWPHVYEQRWAWMFPAWFLYFELEAVKRTTSSGSVLDDAIVKRGTRPQDLKS